MDELCPICSSKLNNNISEYNGKDEVHFSCSLCGKFILSRSLIASLPDIIESDKDASTKISHSIRMMQKIKANPKFNTYTIEEILKRPLPKPREQADLFLRWLAEHIDSPGELISVTPSTHRSLIGAKTDNGFKLILEHLFKVGLVEGSFSRVISRPNDAKITLSFAGWEYYEQLQLGKKTYRKAFMAMKFGVAELDNILDETIKPAVRQTGFILELLSDTPRAGLIDDRLRTQIQISDFIIADLTHDNLGAYWEAGYAEGLGKPVIYTCEKNKFEQEKTHFDTNHHLTIIWDADNPKQAAEDLKATIRATLPHLAKQEDE